MNPSESPTAKAMDRAIDLAIEGESPYPEHAAFIEGGQGSSGVIFIPHDVPIQFPLPILGVR